MSRLVYNQDYLELNKMPVREGDILELNVMGYWLNGDVHRDASGWYLMTHDQVGIRLAAGLRARFPLVAPIVAVSAYREGQIKHEKNT